MESTGNFIGNGDVAEKRAEMTRHMEMMAKREKSFEESSIEEKLERLRQEIIGLRRQNQWQRERLQRFGSIAEYHQHSITGAVLVPADRPSNQGADLASGSMDPLR